MQDMPTLTTQSSTSRTLKPGGRSLGFGVLYFDNFFWFWVLFIPKNVYKFCPGFPSK